MVEAGLVLSRFLHYAASLILFGVSLFPLYTYPGRAGKSPARVRRWQQVTALTAALCALFSGSLWFICVVAKMTGTLSGAVDRDALWSVLSETSFGTVWLARFLVMTLLVGLIAARVTLTTHHQVWLTPALSAGLLASLAAAGHTQMQDGVNRVIHLSADGLHLLAAGAWLGGLLLLFYLVGAATRTASPDLASEAINAATQFGQCLVSSWLLYQFDGNAVWPAAAGEAVPVWGHASTRRREPFLDCSGIEQRHQIRRTPCHALKASSSCARRAGFGAFHHFDG
jgi:putative copper export protein